VFPTEQQPDDAVAYFQSKFDQMVRNIERVVYGKREAVRNALICLFAEGHLLIEDVPGVAKTSLARAIADSIKDAQIRRIQFTPDLLPSDVIGVQIFDQILQDFRFRAGPVFAHVVVGDEINRATPKTQSALLEIMAEHQVTVDGVTYESPRPFLCIATQNPIEHHGTFPLPEAQLDRFMMRINVGYPGIEEETQIIASGGANRTKAKLEQVIDVETMRMMTRTAAEVTVVAQVCRYIATLAAATRGEDGERRGLRLGISPRGCLALAAAAQALAASDGRSYVTPDDVRELAVPVLSHRLLLGHHATAERRSQADVIEDLKRTIKPPGV
jgi:MoxR-like ATPase